METAPALFISHGAPTFALEPGLLGPKLVDIGSQLSEVKALLVVSPHWQTRWVSVMTTAAPRTIHDFRGFPEPLYGIRYPAAGHRALAEDVARSLADAGFQIELDPHRGLDHGAWVPLLYLSADARIPVFQVSMPADLDAPTALRLGRALAQWRSEGVAVVGSGSLTHNLSEFRGDVAEAAPYAHEFTLWVRDVVMQRDLNRLVDYRRQAPHAQRAHPTEEHFLPLIIAIGTASDMDTITVIEGGVTYGMLSMESYAWGLA